MKAFEKLNVDRIASRYTEHSLHRAPHKPLLLLSLIELIESGELKENRIQPTSRLMEIFWSYSSLIPQKRRRDLHLPFHHMKSESFWTLYDDQNRVSTDKGQPKSIDHLRISYSHAEFSSEVWDQLIGHEGRMRARATILKFHFTESAAQKISEQMIVNDQTSAILAEIGLAENTPETVQRPVRDQLFRRRIQLAYDHRCAFTGLRLLTPSYRTAIDAAHIRPWSVFKDDRVQNGMALSKLCHWAFDAGLLSVNGDMEVIVSKVVRNQSQERVGILLDLHGQEIHLPKEANLIPDESCLKWHRGNRYDNW